MPPHIIDDDVSEQEDLSESLTDSDDSQEDPTFTEALSRLSRLSVQHKLSSRIVVKGKGRMSLDEDLGDVDTDLAEPVLFDEVNQKSFECVETLIRDGKFEKLKIDQCKVYLRKYGLRLTGNKDVLIERIKEHTRILNNGGEREYPPSSFVLNCKGDACMGDVVMFEQRVYEKYDLASRSGPPIGTRVSAGRIIKESYGAAKQQHTFTIEILWSKGEKPLPPLYPLLIKGRNLYRMNTLRQRWENETLREQALKDKHSRGEAARTDRETRILVKKMKRELRGERFPRTKNSNKDEATLIQTARMTLQRNVNEKNHPQNLTQFTTQPDTLLEIRRVESTNILGAQRNKFIAQVKSQVTRPMMNKVYPQALRVQRPSQTGFEAYHSQHHHHYSDKVSAGEIRSYHDMGRRPLATQNYQRPPESLDDTGYDTRPFSSQRTNQIFSQHGRGYHQNHGWKPCRYYAQGRCHYGSNCKFSHDI